MVQEDFLSVLDRAHEDLVLSAALVTVVVAVDFSVILLVVAVVASDFIRVVNVYFANPITFCYSANASRFASSVFSNKFFSHLDEPFTGSCF